MIYFLYGSDTYRSRRKVHEILNAFRQKAQGLLNVVTLDAEEHSELVLGVGRTPSLFARKELFVIEGVLEARIDIQDVIQGRVEVWSRDQNLTIIFFERDISDRSSRLFRAIQESATKSQEFRPLSHSALRRWIDHEALARRLRLQSSEKTHLMTRHGHDLWAIAAELDKMTSGWLLHELLREEEKIWNFTNAFFQNHQRAFLALVRLLALGHDPIYLLGAFAGTLRTLARARHDAVKSTAQNIRGGSGRSGVVGRLPSVAERQWVGIIPHYYSRLLEADEEIKTGRLPPFLPLMKFILKR